MILCHNGVVRAVSRDGRSVTGMTLKVDQDRAAAVIAEISKKPGIILVKLWVNEGELSPGDDIMYVMIAGDFRENVIAALTELVSKVKAEVLDEIEKYC